MNENLYSILDVKSNFYGSLMTFKNDSVAIRAFMEMLISNDPSSMLHLYPTDYCLFCLGSLDKESGVITPHLPQLVVTGYDCYVKAVDEVARRHKFAQALEKGEISSVERPIQYPQVEVEVKKGDNKKDDNDGFVN